jgi:hypothetical protein
MALRCLQKSLANLNLLIQYNNKCRVKKVYELMTYLVPSPPNLDLSNSTAS